jgi:amino acid transporter
MRNVDNAGEQIRHNSPVLTSHADTRTFYPETLGYRLKRKFLGEPYVSEQLKGERLNNPTALGVLAPDCISSSSYGAEQILTQLTPAIGLAAFSLLVPIMFVILGVLVLVTLSYLDVIGAYSIKGGSYIVTRDNFGPKTAQITAVALLIDYIVTVAVQSSAGTAAMTSAFPTLLPYTLWITVGVVLLLIYVNLRGLKEAGAFFAFPSYFFIAMMSLTIFVGLYKHFAGSLEFVKQPAADLLVGGQLGTQGHGFLFGVAFLTLLRAYANGGSSLTGLEAISDSVSGFKRPEAYNARKVMLIMAGILSFLLIGTTMLATWTHALPYAAGSPTVVSQEVAAVFGTQGFGHIIYLLVQLATVAILYTGANTAFNGFPFLANFVATDKYLPRQLTKRGHRLAFSTGIIWLGTMALVLIFVFNASVNGLIALYAIGVFTAFTMAGAGMAKRHWTTRAKRWQLGFAINGLSAFTCLIVALIFGVVKFGEGAWMVVCAAPFMFWGLIHLHKQYAQEEEAFESGSGAGTLTTSHNRIVVFVDQYDLATERALAYCKTLSSSTIRAIHFDIDPAVTKELEERWGRSESASSSIPLEIMECEDRRVDRAALEVVSDMVRDPKVFAMVILPRRGFTSRIQRLLHDRTADTIASAVMHVPRTAATIVPYRMKTVVPTAQSVDAPSADVVVRGGHREEAHLEADEILDTRRSESHAGEIGAVTLRQKAKLAGRVKSITVEKGANGQSMSCLLSDSTGSIKLVFQGRDIVPGLERGVRLLVSGTVTSFNREAVIMNPEYEIVAGASSEEG